MRFLKITDNSLECLFLALFFPGMFQVLFHRLATTTKQALLKMILEISLFFFSNFMTFEILK